MLPELGNFALALALTVALLQALVPLAGAATGRVRWLAVAAPASLAQALLVAVAFAILAACFVGNDFSVLAVARHSNTQLPAVYRFAATWGSHEGSLLLWTLMLALWTAALALSGRNLTRAAHARAVAALGLLSAGFLVFTLATSNPFARLFPAALEGRDLNPLLQDPGMALHPPMLYMGYAGFGIAYALAMAGLADGGFDAALLAAMRRWAARAWACLTLGIALGSWWAYRELGWGGWWFWDPVENASLMPWLAGTAMLHALPAARRRQAMLGWAVVLAVATFALSLLGTFLMRSGVLTSVHAFATDPLRGVFILGFVAVVVLGSAAMLAWRPTRLLGPAPAQGASGAVDAGAPEAGGVLGRESMLLANTLLLAVACGSVLLGTVYPVAVEALGVTRLSVGPPYFESVLLPVFLPLALLAGVGPLARWRGGSAADALRRLAPPAIGATAACASIAVLWPPWSPLALAGLWLACWIAAATVAGAARSRGKAAGAGTWAMRIAHLGLAVFVAGVTVVKSRGTEHDVRLARGQAVTVAGVEFALTGFDEVAGPNFAAVRAEVRVSRDGRPLATLHPEKRVYHAQPGTPMTEAAVQAGVFGDVYVALGEPAGPDAWTLRLQLKPLVGWIWGGCVLMAAGGLLAGVSRVRRMRPGR
jgi:cytochrome c-type biogenesis protein CcmF